MRLCTALVWLTSAASALSGQPAQMPHGMYCGGNQLLDMGGRRAESVSGTVGDQTGTVIPHARVQLQVQSSGRLVRSIRADDRGRFTLSHLRPGDYWVGISSPGFNLNFWHLHVVHHGHNISLRAELSLGT
jgi:hypothetical protein